MATTTAPKKRAAQKKPIARSKKVTSKKAPARKVTPAKKNASQAKNKHTAKKTSRVLTHKEISRQAIRQPLGHLLLEQKLREAGFVGEIENDPSTLASYSTDESIFSITPQIIISPKRQKDVATAVQVFKEHTKFFSHISLTPRSAGTGLSGGSLTDSVVIDTARHLHGIEAIETSRHGVSITVLPGTYWQTVEKALKRYDVYIPSLPASKDICTVGGSIANNAAGPNSLRYGHMASWVESLEVVLSDGNTYHIAPLSYSEYKRLIKKDNAYAHILKEVVSLLSAHGRTISANTPKTKKNSAGYALWDVIDGSITDFKKGKAKLDMTRLFSGSQGTIGIITKISLKTTPIEKHQSLIVVPVFDLSTASRVISEALKYNPINIEVFDALSFDLALQNPAFFKDRLGKLEYYRVMFSMYTTYHVRYKRKIPAFTFLITLDEDSAANTSNVLGAIRQAGGTMARSVINPYEVEMLWQVRRASYTLSKFQDESKRPAAFLEDMTVPPAALSSFLSGIQKLLRTYHVTAAIHGHGGNGHFHFYPLIDFTKQGVATLIEKMSEEFFTLAVEHGGNICGEHNDGIIRTPHLDKVFSKKMIEVFENLEHLFDPDDIFNPGKKVRPRFNLKENIRHTN